METREKVDYNLKEIFQYYRNTRENTVDYKTFSHILKLFNVKLLQHAFNADYLILPSKIGDIYVKKYKPSYKFKENGEIDTYGKPGLIDFKATKDLWEKHPELAHKQWLVYDNHHSDGYKLKIYWRRGAIKNILLYNFRPARVFKRGLAKFTRNNPNRDYYDN